MNEKQRYVVIAAAVAVALALVFPPFHFRTYNGVIINLGYWLLFNPPLRWISDTSSIAGAVTVSVLLLEWAAITLVAGALWWILKNKP